MTKGMQAFYLVFCLTIAFAVWMLGYGIGLRLFYKDGRILEATLTSNPFAPVQQLWAYGSSPSLRKVALGAVLPALFAAGLVAYIGLKPVSNPLGDASFQDIAALRRGKWFRKDGHIFGRIGRRILRTRDDRHHLVIGPTRSGKGAGYVIPNALSHEGSMIVTDLKGEIFQSTAGYRRQKGSQVFLFAPGSETTNCYNPLDFVREDRGNRTTDIQNIASILVPENTESENSIWQATAQQVIGGVISYILESPWYKDRRNLGEVNAFFNSGYNLQALMRYVKEKEPSLSKFTVESFNAYVALSDRAASSALLDIQKAMRPFRNERIEAATKVTDMDLRAMKRRPITIYLAPNITDITLLRPLLTLFVQQVMDILTLEHDPASLPVYFLLDEFRQLKKMNEVMTKLPYVAGYNIKLAFIIQDLKNLDEIYGETSRHSLLGNCGYQLILGANDQATADYASRALGKRTIRYQSESRTIELLGLPRRTRVEQIRERDLMMPQEIRQMPADRMVLLVEGQRPIHAEKLRFYETQPFKSAVIWSKEHVPEIQSVSYMPSLPVPATTERYAEAGDPEIKLPGTKESGNGEQKPDQAPETRRESEQKTAKSTKANAPTKRISVQDTKTTDPVPEAPAARKMSTKTARSVVAIEALEGRISTIEEQIRMKSEKLKEKVEAVALRTDKPLPRTRKNYLEVYGMTVPDPIEEDSAEKARTGA